MHCHSVPARNNWREQAHDRGYNVALLTDPPYWIEAIEDPFCAVFSQKESSEIIDSATAELTKLALQLVEEICCSAKSEHYFDYIRIPGFAREPIRRSWKRHDKSLFGRFDFAYNENSLKLLELNFDTPTSLYESAHLQRLWIEASRQLQSIPLECTQSNSIQEKLIATFRSLIPYGQVFHLGTFEHAIEETENLKYLQSCAVQAGLETQFIYLDDLKYNANGRLVDLQGRIITCLFKLFPWELLFLEDAKSFASSGKYLFAPLIMSNETTLIEPAWKSILSNKAILPLLWNMAPNHRYLLEASLDDNSESAKRLANVAHVRKPIFGREGSGVSIRSEHSPEETHQDGRSEEPCIVQAYAPLQTYRDFHLVIGSWVVDGEPAGICIRADQSKITGRNALFVPHYVI
ncbi:glutathionylspermidine synthase family protein [soil metagenome]